MSTISIFSYILIFSVMITSVFTSLRKLNSIYLILVIVFSYLGLSLYFTDIQYHDNFLGIIILTLQLMYNIYLVPESRSEGSNLFIYVGSFLLPLYLLNTENCWDHVIIIALIEILRIVSSNDIIKKEAKSNLLNYLSANLKIFILILSTTIAVTVTKTDAFSIVEKIEELYIGIPVVIFYILAFVYNGGLNSKVVENYNINNFKAKNLLSYVSINKIVIPYVLLVNAKRLISKVSIDLFIIIDEILVVSIVLMSFYFIFLYYNNKSRNIRLTAIQNISLVPMSYMFITNDLINGSEYLAYLVISSLLFSFIILIEKYQVSFRKISLWVSKFILFNSPLSPLLYLNLHYLYKFKLIYSDYISLILFIIMIAPSFWLISEINTQSKTKSKNSNSYANSRLIFIIICIVIVIINLSL
jgi:hypothetical protein